MRQLLILAWSVIFLSPGAASASSKSFCGTIDIVKISNEELSNILVLADVGRGGKGNLTQCGLPGEDAVFCTSCADTTSPEMMNYLRPVLATGDHLEWHARWHQIRALRDQLTDAEYEKLRLEGQVPGDESLETFQERHGVGGTLAGEDFLSMHRLMIKMTQIELSSQGLACINPWRSVPLSVDDSVWPVPRSFPTPEIRTNAEQELAKVHKQLAKLRNPERLRQLSLNQLGRIIEPSFHQALHDLYRSNPICSREAKAQGLCDDLVPVETSPLNKYFWKIHGFIDNLVGEWLNANGYREISINCDGRSQCHSWSRNLWIGKYPRGQ